VDPSNGAGIDTVTGADPNSAWTDDAGGVDLNERGSGEPAESILDAPAAQ
jgi:hypothetical protein